MKERDMLIWLNSLRGINNRYMEFLDSSLEDIRELWSMRPEEVRKIEGIGETLKDSIIEERIPDKYRESAESMKERGVKAITIKDGDYPERLREIPDPPRVLYIRGSLKEQDRLSVSIVGPRKASSYGIWAAEKFAIELSKLGITVVSGMALGVDAAAHIASLDSGGRTLAVLGTGVDVVYPSRNRHIYERIVESGAVISEFPLGAKGLPYRFPQRNRIVSGISLGTIIVEAGESSGTLTTASHGLDQGREVFAVPGNINSAYSKGSNKLIQDGAKLVQDIDDVLSEILELRNLMERKSSEKEEEHLGESEKKVLQAISLESLSAEGISLKLDMPVSSVLGILTVLEIKRKVRKKNGGLFFKL